MNLVSSPNDVSTLRNHVEPAAAEARGNLINQYHRRRLIMADSMPNSTLDPEARFSGPADVSRQSDLTRQQKIDILSDWHQLVQQRLDSAAEGMLPDPSTSANTETGSPSKEAELLRQIDLELETLSDDTQEK